MKINTVRPNGTRRDVPYDDVAAEMFREEPEIAVELLNQILEDGEQGEMLIALRQITKAFGGVSAVAGKAELNATQLYRTLSEQGNPSLNTFVALLKAMGMRLAVQQIPQKRQTKPSPRKKAA